jgi:trans-aconitate methyltransferase
MSDERAAGLNRLRIDTTVAHPARVYDFWLGGKDNYAPDREAAEQVIARNPGILPAVRCNRALLVRMVTYLAREAGIRQFLDLGAGLPSNNNVHEVARRVAPDTRVVYVDNDPIVLVHARALLGGHGTVAFTMADIREPRDILAEAANTLDFSQPVAVLLLMTLQFVPDDQDPCGILAQLMSATVPGSHLAISHPALEQAGDVASRATERYNQLVATGMTRRTHAEIARFFDGLELVEPGIVPLAQWRPEPGDPDATGSSPALCGLGRRVGP